MSILRTGKLFTALKAVVVSYSPRQRHARPPDALRQNAPMDTIAARDAIASFLAKQDAQTLSQALLELAVDYEPVYQRLERLRLRDDPATLAARFSQQLHNWETDDRFVRHQDAAALGRYLDVWVAQVQREVLPRYPGEAMALFAAFLDLDRVVFERVDDDGGYVGGAFEKACELWLTAAAAAGLSAAEIEGHVSALLVVDNYGARAGLQKGLVR